MFPHIQKFTVCILDSCASESFMYCTLGLSHQKKQVVPHVLIEAPDFCSEVDDMSWTVLLEHSFGLPEVSVHICLNLVVKIVKTYMLEKELCHLRVPV